MTQNQNRNTTISNTDDTRLAFEPLLPAVPSYRLLDLYCGGGGASYGYELAGWEVVGVDIAPQPKYRGKFIQANALEYVKAHYHEFDAIYLKAILNLKPRPTRSILHQMRRWEGRLKTVSSFNMWGISPG